MQTYFARPVGRETPIKIGRSGSPIGRVWADVRWIDGEGLRHKCELLATIDQDLEGRFHARFAGWHEGGEWFTANPELLDFIPALQCVEKMLESLPAKRRLGGVGKHYKAHIGINARPSLPRTGGMAGSRAAHLSHPFRPA